MSNLVPDSIQISHFRIWLTILGLTIGISTSILTWQNARDEEQNTRIAETRKGLNDLRVSHIQAVESLRGAAEILKVQMSSHEKDREELNSRIDKVLDWADKEHRKLAKEVIHE